MTGSILQYDVHSSCRVIYCLYGRSLAWDSVKTSSELTDICGEANGIPLYRAQQPQLYPNSCAQKRYIMYVICLEHLQIAFCNVLQDKLLYSSIMFRCCKKLFSLNKMSQWRQRIWNLGQWGWQFIFFVFLCFSFTGWLFVFQQQRRTFWYINTCHLLFVYIFTMKKGIPISSP